MNLHEQFIQERTLFRAWEQVRDNRGAPGVDGQRVEDFAVNAFGRLQTLREQVLRGEYRPSALKVVDIPKQGDGFRRLLIPTVRDRILHTACAMVLSPLLEAGFEDTSFAYRPGRSVPMAVARVAWLRDRGHQWLVDADIRRFFDEVDHQRLLSKLGRALADDPGLLPLIELWLAATCRPEPPDPPWLLERGIPQGSPLSPLLANLYLDDFDEALSAKGLQPVRFADDFVILCPTEAAAREALAEAERLLAAEGLQLNRDKTRIRSFEEGFRFLGVDFVRNLMRAADPEAARWLLPDAEDRRRAAPAAEPVTGSKGEGEGKTVEPALPEELPAEIRREVCMSLRTPTPEGVEDDALAAAMADGDVRLEPEATPAPLLRTLHVARHGVALRKEGERLLVTERREVLASIPLHRIDQVVVQGNQMISTALLARAARDSIQVTFTDAAGRFRGFFAGARSRALELEAAQYRLRQDSDFALMMARACVGAKIHNARVVLRRFARRRPEAGLEPLLESLARLEARLTIMPDVNRVRGVEGAAAHVHFQALARLLPEEWGFPGRRRRPPTDPMNLLLSYGYGVLFHTMHTLVERRRLHAWLGHLHVSDGRHPALVSDLIEEFRALVVDAVALHALLNHFEPDDFRYDESDTMPCRMREPARRRYLEFLHNKFRSTLLHRPSGRRLDHHRLMQWQVDHYARVLRGREPVYRPYRAR